MIFLSVLDISPDFFPVAVVLLAVHALFKVHFGVHVDFLAHRLEELGARLLIFGFSLGRGCVAWSVLAGILEDLRGCLHLTQFLLFLSLCKGRFFWGIWGCISAQLIHISDLLEPVPVDRHIGSQIAATFSSRFDEIWRWPFFVPSMILKQGRTTVIVRFLCRGWRVWARPWPSMLPITFMMSSLSISAFITASWVTRRTSSSMPLMLFLVSFRPLFLFTPLLVPVFMFMGFWRGATAILEHLNLFLDFLEHDRVTVNLLPLFQLFLLDQDKWVILHP